MKTQEEMQSIRNREKWENRLNQGGRFKRAFWTAIYKIGTLFSFGRWAPLKKSSKEMPVVKGKENPGQTALETRSPSESGTVSVAALATTKSGSSKPPSTALTSKIVGLFSNSQQEDRNGKSPSLSANPLIEFAGKLIKSLNPTKEKSLTGKGRSLWKRIWENRNAISQANQDNHNTQIEWYTDSDITDYVSTVIRNDITIGGFVENSEHLLKKQPREEIIAICDAIDSVGQAVPINYFLNKHVLLEDEKRKKDVFTELMPKLLEKPLGATINEARILFPYNKTQMHWLAGEIKIKKIKNDEYQVEVYSHDPYGGGKMTDSAYETIKQTIIQRIQEEIPGAVVQVKNSQSPYKRRQAAEDGVSCGPITAETILDIIRLGAPQNIPEYPLNAVQLRQKQVKCMEEFLPNTNATKVNFLKRNTQPLLNRKSGEESNASIEVETIAKLINNIQNEKLKDGIFSAVFEKMDIEKEPDIFWQCIISAVEDIPPLLSSDGEVLSDQDINTVNELFLHLLPIKTLLFDEQLKIHQKAYSFGKMSP